MKKILSKYSRNIPHASVWLQDGYDLVTPWLHQKTALFLYKYRNVTNVTIVYINI